MAQHVTQRSFRGGEWSGDLIERVDLSQYSEALSLAYNAIVHVTGGVSNRPGFRFVESAKFPDKRARLRVFQFSVVETYMLEFGDRYVRFYRGGGRIILPSTPAAWVTSTAYAVADHVSVSGINYYCYSAHTSGAATQPGVGASWTSRWHALTDEVVEIPLPYLESDLDQLSFTQEADILTITHPSYPPADLIRTDHHKWEYSVRSFSPLIATPQNLSLVLNGVVGSGTTRSYVVTAIDEATGEESLRSSALDVDTGPDATWTEGQVIRISWDSVSGASTYNVYKEIHGIYGFIAKTGNTFFQDDKIAPDTVNVAPPAIAENPFDGAGNYPGVAEYHDQRMIFARTNNAPQTIITTQTGYYNNMNRSDPSKADDRVEFRLSSREVNEIRALVSVSDLLAFTSGGEWRIKGSDGYLSATSTPDAKRQSNWGSSHVQPLLIGNSVLFIHSSGSMVRDLAYTIQSEGYDGVELSATFSHQLDDYQITSWCYAQRPHAMIAMVRSDGKLLTLTYSKEHQVTGWCWHETDGEFEAVESVREGALDYVYAVIKRTVGGSAVRYIERLDVRKISTVENAFFVDSGLSYDGTPTTTISGLSHLEGREVAILADGNVHQRRTVSNGSITLDYPASKVHAGLPYESQVGTLPIDTMQGMKGRKLTVVTLTAKVNKSRGLWVASKHAPDREVELQQRTNEAWNEATRLYTGVIDVTIDSDWETDGALLFTQRDPLPMTILSVTPEVEYGG